MFHEMAITAALTRNILHKEQAYIIELTFP